MREFIFALTLLLVSTPTMFAQEDGWENMFNGQNLLAWHVNENSDSFSVDDGCIVVKINGNTISDYTEPDDLKRPRRQLSSGTFALQAHDPGSKVLYKALMYKKLDD